MKTRLCPLFLRNAEHLSLRRVLVSTRRDSSRDSSVLTRSGYITRTRLDAAFVERAIPFFIHFSFRSLSPERVSPLCKYVCLVHITVVCDIADRSDVPLCVCVGKRMLPRTNANSKAHFDYRRLCIACATGLSDASLSVAQNCTALHRAALPELGSTGGGDSKAHHDEPWSARLGAALASLRVHITLRVASCPAIAQAMAWPHRRRSHSLVCTHLLYSLHSLRSTPDSLLCPWLGKAAQSKVCCDCLHSK